MRSPKFDALLSRYYTIIIFLIPALTIFTLFVVLPIGEAAYYSFFRWNGYGAPEKFVGFKNYAFLFKNRVFIMSLKNNFYIIAISLFVQLPFALLIALMISDKLRGAAFFRTIFFLPFILAEIVTALIWAYIYDGNYGLVAAIWGFFGAEAPFVLGDKDWALVAILIVIFEYPEPEFEVVKPVIVPVDETIAVNAAPTPIFPEVINASTLPSPD